MNEHSEHNPSDHEDPAVGSTWFVGVAGVLILVVTLAGVTALFHRATDQEIQKEVVNKPVWDFPKIVAAQQDELTKPARIVDRTEGDATVKAYVIPIERAMELTVKEYASK